MAGPFPPAPPRRSGLPWLIAAVLVIAIAGFGVAAVLLTVAKEHSRPDYAAVEAVARETALAMTSFTSATVRDDLAKATKSLTGDALVQWRDQSDVVASGLESQHSSATGTVVALGVTSADAFSATVLVFADQAIKSASGQPTRDRSRLQFHLVNIDGHWLIDRFAVV